MNKREYKYWLLPNKKSPTIVKMKIEKMETRKGVRFAYAQGRWVPYALVYDTYERAYVEMLAMYEDIAETLKALREAY